MASFPNECQHLFGGEIEGKSSLFFAVDANGLPHLLFEAENQDTLLDLELKYIDVQFLRKCTITINDGREIEKLCTIIKFKDSDCELIHIFLDLIEEALLFQTIDHSSQSIRAKIIAMIEIFSRLDNSINDVVGLWGELHIIHRSTNPDKLAKAWCTSETAQFDFVGEHFALEVKASTKSTRRHHFSLEQVRPSNNVRSYVCSLQLIETRSGCTVGELMDKVLTQISDATERSQVYHQCLRKGGADIYRSILQLGVLPDGSSLAVFDAQNIPAPAVNNNEPIFNIRFEADLTNAKQLSKFEAKTVLEL